MSGWRERQSLVENIGAVAVRCDGCRMQLLVGQSLGRDPLQLGRFHRWFSFACVLRRPSTGMIGLIGILEISNVDHPNVEPRFIL